MSRRSDAMCFWLGLIQVSGGSSQPFLFIPRPIFSLRGLFLIDEAGSFLKVLVHVINMAWNAGFENSPHGLEIGLSENRPRGLELGLRVLKEADAKFWPTPFDLS